MTDVKGSARRALGLAAVSIVVLGVTSCRSTSHNAGPAAAPVSSAAVTVATGAVAAQSPSVTAGSSPVTAQVSAPGGSAHAIDVCAILPAASAAKLSGQPITTAVARTGLLANEYGCAYDSDDDTVGVDVTVFEHDAASSYNVFFSASTGATTVSGLGDKAFFDNAATMYVLAGNNLIQVDGLKTADQCAALARPVLAAL